MEYKDEVSPQSYQSLDEPSPPPPHNGRSHALLSSPSLVSVPTSPSRRSSRSTSARKSAGLHPAFSAPLPSSSSPVSSSSLPFSVLTSAPPSSSSIVIRECAELLSTGSTSDVYHAASVYIHDGLSLRAIHHGLSPQALKLYMFRQRLAWYLLMRVLCIVQLCLVLVEPPSSFSFRITKLESALIEFFILLIFSFDTYLSYRALTRAGFIRSRFRQLKVLCLAVCLIDSVWTFASPLRPFRLCRLLRVFFLTERSGRLRRVLKSLLRAAPVIGNVLFLLALHVLTFGFVGWMLFAHLERADPSGFGCRIRDGEAGGVAGTEKCYFQDLNSAFISLFILLTNANFPDIMMPSYRTYRPSFLFFAMFLLIGLYLLMQLVLAVIFHTFKNHTVRDVNYYAQRADRAFRAAFYLLGSIEARTGLMHLNSWLHVMRECRPDVTEAQSKLIFRAVQDGSEAEAANKVAREKDGKSSPSDRRQSENADREVDGRRRSSVAVVRGPAEDEAHSINYTQFKDICHLIHVRFFPMDDEDTRYEPADSLASPSALPHHARSSPAKNNTSGAEEGEEKEREARSMKESRESNSSQEGGDDSLRTLNNSILLPPSVSPTRDANILLAPPLGDTSLLEEVDASDDEANQPAAEVTEEDEEDLDGSLHLSRFTCPSFMLPMVAWLSTRSQGILTRKTLDLVVDVLCVIFVVLTIVQAELVHIEGTGQTTNQTDADSVTFLTVLQSLLMAIFIVELSAKLVLMRWTYFRSAFRTIDLYLMLLSLLGQSLWWANTMIIVSFYLRPLRVLRLGRVLRRLKAILNTLLLMLPALTPLLTLQALVFYVFAILGMNFFQDKLTPATVPESTGLEYALNNYYANNFDDVLRSYVTLFELLIGNNWYYVMDACVHVTSSWAMVYFILFYSVSVLVVMNVLTAFILEAFLMQQQRDEQINERRKQHKRRMQDRERRREEARMLGEVGRVEDEELELDEAKELAAREDSLLPKHFRRLEGMSERELHQHVEMKAATGMGAVLLKMYRMSVHESEE